MTNAYVINLADATERWRWIEAQLGALPIEIKRLAAVRGSALSPEEIRLAFDEAAVVKRYGRSFTPPEVGCCLSHIEVYDRLAAASEDWALVFEDDAAVSPSLAAILPGLEKWLRSDAPRVVLMTRLRRFATRGAIRLAVNHRLVRVWNAWYAHGYALNRSAAMTLRTRLRPVSYLADNWKRIGAELGVDIRGIDPYCVGQSALAKESAIGDEREELREGAARKGRLRKIVHHVVIEKMIATPLLGLKKHEKTW